jgi:hypothetical protein
MAGKVDFEAIKVKLLNTREFENTAKEEAKNFVEQRRLELQSQFLNHPVTLEIKDGPDAKNGSGTLGGYGNLFSFIGFEKGFDPISPILALIKKIKVARKVNTTKTGITFEVDIPTKEEFEEASKLPWESGRSWLFDIEKVISGLGYYLYQKRESSRSGAGIETQKSVNNLVFKPVKYFGTLLENFKNKLNNK